MIKKIKNHATYRNQINQPNYLSFDEFDELERH